MIQSKKNIHYSLYPLSILYGWGISFRNFLFDRKFLPSESFATPIICVGNLTVGGTGKTPHIEYLIRILSPHYRIAVLSRGYKRKTKGFILANEDTTPRQIGDEPYQIKSKFPEIMVAVDADRRNGIRQLESTQTPPEVILLDDAFQHRYVKPGFSILLTDYNRLYYQDALLPAGRLREGSKGKERTNLFIVSKSPADLIPENQEEIRKQIAPTKNQQVFFSTLAYQPLQRVFGQDSTLPDKNSEILLVTGIARPETIERQIKKTHKLHESIIFPDHHDFTERDIELISLKFREIKNNKKAIIVTEKDAVRFRHNPYVDNYLKENMYFLPLEIVFLHNETNRFNQIILDYVAENQRNS